MPRLSPGDQAKVRGAFSEVMHKTPSTVTRAKVSGPRKQKMKVAIALDKARRSGADIPYKNVRRGRSA